MDLEILVERAKIDQPECVLAVLKKMGITSYMRLQNLPAKWGPRLLCGQSVHVLIDKLNKAMVDDTAEVADANVVMAEIEDPLLTSLAFPPGVTETHLETLAEAGVQTVGQAKTTDMTKITGIGKITANKVLKAVEAA